MAKVLLVAHWDWVLYNFRLSLARALRDKGCEVAFVCPFGEYIGRLQRAGFHCIHWSVVRRSLNPAREILAITHLARIYQREGPDVVHHFTIKPNLYGSIAAAFIGNGNLRVINTFTGLGFLFSDHPIAKKMRPFAVSILRVVVRATGAWTVAQNCQDAACLAQWDVAIPKRLSVIASSGVDIRRFSPDERALSRNDSSPPIVLMAARLLWDKGVGEFVEAARMLNEKGIIAEFWVAGKPDEGNPMYVPEKWLREQHERGIIKWLGHCDDMPQLLHQVDIAVLPSYHEGVSRFLLEAAACGLPLVATDIEGCRMIVQDGVNGFIIPARDADALAKALERLMLAPALRRRMGRASRQIAVQEFDEQKILAQWLALYEQVLTHNSKDRASSYANFSLL